ncbi:D(1)-like dopamine receptor [Exaiptasia diaphana]|uniref:G-protein coupled receptors family 1 profile domain-containing protein n=1 Tax=Exaiptasia diaphana TaxID=2652724 RepID=A0A913Y6M8_EXADI|nr:D(1)-like dopamine receptor [Exaiptasia diaphana]
MATYTVTSAVLGALITVENLIVCFLVYRFHYLRTWTNGFITSLAVSDILFGVIVVPLHIIDASSPANGYLIAMVLLVNITNLLSTTFDRYLAVLKPFFYTIFMERGFRRILVSAWVVPIVTSMLPIIWSADPMTTIHTVYLLCVLVVGILVPYTLIIIAYVRIFREVIKQVKKLLKLCVTTDRQTSRTRRDAAMKETKRMATEAKVAKVFAVVTGIFVVGWMPLVYMTGVQAVHKLELIPPSLPIIAWYTLCVSTLVNAPIYAYFKSDFRRSLKTIFKRKNERRLLAITTTDEHRERCNENSTMIQNLHEYDCKPHEEY